MRSCVVYALFAVSLPNAFANRAVFEDKETKDLQEERVKEKIRDKVVARRSLSRTPDTPQINTYFSRIHKAYSSNRIFYLAMSLNLEIFRTLCFLVFHIHSKFNPLCALLQRYAFVIPLHASIDAEPFIWRSAKVHPPETYIYP